MTDSDIVSATYTIEKPEPGTTVATPTIKPDGGEYKGSIDVEISCSTDGAEIHYTTDDSEPTAGSTLYSGEIEVKETTTIKAIAVKKGMTDSSVASATYTIKEEPEPEEHSISVSPKSKSIKPGERFTVTATTVPENQPVTWYSLNNSIATVSTGEDTGVAEITGVAEGEAQIIASFVIDEVEYIDTVDVTVTSQPAPPKPVDPDEDDEEEQKKKEAETETEAERRLRLHTHHYVWETIEATEESDGELRYACDICGAVQTRVPISAYYVFNKNTAEKIRKAGQGATVYVETSRCISFHKMVMEALAERPDVTLRISFLDEEYKGNRVTVTIPAGTDAMSLVDDNGFVGFLYLALKFGYTM